VNIDRNLDLGVIGNCVISALVDRAGSIVWSCLPRLDGDPVFHALVNGNGGPDAAGHWTIELDGMERCEQEYQGNTAVLATRLFAPAARSRSSISARASRCAAACSARR
jgi:GH15 family glucan-1,4-alpha-glucosidase